MAKKRAATEDDPVDLSKLLPEVLHLPKRSLPFNPKWREDARAAWLALKAQGVSQERFAAWCGCVQGSVSNLLGRKEPAFQRHEYLERFSAALGVELPLRAQLEIEGEAVGDDEENLAKVLDIVRWARSQRK